MTLYVRAANPIWFMVDLTGLPLNDQYYMFVLNNEIPYNPLVIFQDPDGINPWNNPIQFNPDGTLPNNMYWDSSQVYRLEVRQGPNQTDPLIRLVENFAPGGESQETTDTLLTANNMITNPQFADVYFQSPYTFSAAVSDTYTVDIGPGWQLVLTGTGSTTFTQVPYQGSQNITGNPSYALTIDNSGWTSAKLIQRFSNNGSIFSNGAVAIAFTATATPNPQTVTVSYSPSVGMATNILNKQVTSGGFNVYKRAVDLGVSSNSDDDGSAYVDIIFNISGTEAITITNVQLTGQSTPLSSTFSDPELDAPIYQEQTYERSVDQEFHVYRDSLLNQAKDNLLVGWTFGLNPWQFNDTADTTISNQTQYIADQTILHQETNSSVKSGKGGYGVNFGLQLTAINGVNDNRVAIIQYIDSSTINPYTQQTLSCLVRSLTKLSNSKSLGIKMRLIVRGNAIPTISNTEPISSWPADSDPVFAAGWTEVIPENDPEYILGNTYIGGLTVGNFGNGTDFPAYSFNKFQLPDIGATGTLYMGVVVYTTNDLDNTLGNENALYFDRISLVPNDFAIDASPETYNSTLRKCQFYYEKSYAPGVLFGTTTSVGLKFINGLMITAATTDSGYARSFDLDFIQTKRAIPNLAFYSPSNGASDSMYAEIIQNGTSEANAVIAAVVAGGHYFSLANESVDRVELKAVKTSTTAVTWTNLSVLATDECNISYHYTADARLGVV
ncbi:MAG: hypothetical protein C5B43_03865 [Verrucomicrobia bacterium]|nr:MAG: hypothetical protein C5B43_03865 [Verrucomicrobiota bacterium]